MSRAKWLLFFVTLFIFSACIGAEDVGGTDGIQVLENSTIIKATPKPNPTSVAKPNPTSVAKPTVQSVPKPEFISFTAEDIKSIDYISIASISSDEFHEAFLSGNDLPSEKYLASWEGQINRNPSGEYEAEYESFALAIYEGINIDQDIIDALLIEVFILREENPEDNVKAWIFNNIFLVCLVSNGACESLVEDLLSKSSSFNPILSSYNGIVMHTENNDVLGRSVALTDEPDLLDVIMDSYYGAAAPQDVMYKILDLLENRELDPDKTFTQGSVYTDDDIPEGFHPLHLAVFVDAFSDSLEKYQGGISNLLLSYGANPNLKTELYSDNQDMDTVGITPLHIAVMTGQLDMINLLLDYGALINEFDETQNTPLDYIWIPQSMLSNFELFGASTDDMDIEYTQETLDEIKQFLLESGAEHGNGAISKLAQMESTNMIDQLSETLDQAFSSKVYLDSSQSPNGKKIVYIANVPDGNIFSFKIFIMNADGSNQTQITNNPISSDTNPSWSPDGTKIVFSSDIDGQYGFHIFIMNADGSNQTQITNNPISSDTNPSWSPDGTKIVFSSDIDGQYGSNIYVMDSDGTNITLLTTDPNAIAESFNKNASWSPGGTKILFSSDMAGQYGSNIYVMDSDGANITRLTTDQNAFDENPSWSPDGTKISFSSDIEGQYGSNIYVMDSDGANITRLTTDQNAFDTNPSWSPDGTKIVFISNIDGQYGFHIYVMDSDGANITRLTTEEVEN